MFSTKSFIGSSLVTLLGMTALAAADSRLVYVGGHDPARSFTRVESSRETAPYALTGQGESKSTMAPIYVGSRIVGLRLAAQ